LVESASYDASVLVAGGIAVTGAALAFVRRGSLRVHPRA